MAVEVKFPDVRVKLTGTDGNAFAIIGAVQRALRRAGHTVEAKEFAQEAFQCESYDALLQLALGTVDVR